MASGGHNRKTAKELAAAATEREDRILNANNPGRGHIESLLDRWAEVADMAIAEIKSETSVSIVNAGDQVQKHPAVTVLEAASKRIESLVVMVDRFGSEGSDEKPGDLPDDAPPAWGPRAVGD